MRSFNRRFTGSEFVRQSTGASFWNFSGMAFTLINGILTSRLLAPDDRGVLALILTVSSLSFLVSSFGTNTAVRVFQSKEVWSSFRTYFHVSSWLLLLNVALVGMTSVAFAQLGVIESSPTTMFAMVLLGVLIFVSNQLLDVFNAQGLVSWSAAVNNLGHLATLVILFAVLVGSSGDDLVLVLCAYIIGYVTRVCLCFVSFQKRSLSLGGLAPDRGRTLVKQGARFWGINVAQNLTSRADQLLLAWLAGTYSVGIYAVAIAPAAVMQVVSNSIGQMALREAADGSLTAKRLFKATGSGLLLVSIYCVALWSAAPWVIPLVFGSDYEAAVSVVRILVFAELARCPYLIFIRALAGFNRPFAANFSSIVGLPVLVVTMLLLVPHNGAEGAAYSVVITSAISLLASVFSLVGVLKRDVSTTDRTS